ncbi:hypothetical protein [Polaromonas sp.]|uniref:hypothetical protein n=1 Tax=Polaromonas sp. TaxID=1869339 RepID=UPI003BB56802
MTDEKKPPQGAELCGSTTCRREITALKSRAQVVISIDAVGALDMRTYWAGRVDAMYATHPDDLLLGPILQSAIAELRLQVRENRRATAAESQALKKKAESLEQAFADYRARCALGLPRVDEAALVGLLRQAPAAGHHDTTAAVVEWQDGEHTHLAFEVMGADGAWFPLAAVALNDCRADGVRLNLRQFPMFRLAWYGQVGEPSNTPQRLMPEHDSRVSSDASTRS